jgi:RNA polymerase sigma-70 factor (ECF subfamily)
MDSRNRFDVIALLAPLRRYAAVLTRDETEAEDLLHDALVRAYERRQTFRGSGNLRGWLFSVLHNSFVDGRRRNASEAGRLATLAVEAESVAPAGQESSVRLQQIRAAFLGLPDEQRAALHLVAIEGLSYQEAAGTLGIPLGTLMSRIGRARAALRSFEEGVALLPPAETAADPQAASRPNPNLRIVGGTDG